MYLCFQKQDLVVADFQLVYDTDNYIQLDFYAEGLRKEPLLYEQSIFAKRISYGFLTGKYQDYKCDELFFNNKMENRNWVMDTSRKMIRSILTLHKITKKIEESLDKKEYSMDLWESYFSAIADSISFKRFSQTCESKYYPLEDELFNREIKNIRIPSHIVLFYRKLDELKQNPNDKEIQEFIHKYGFLYDFNIAVTPFEKVSNLVEILKNQQVGLVREKTRKTHSENFSVILYKRVAWYEEMRHYYQARALRNYRVLFEQLHLNIYETGVTELYEKMKEVI